MRFGSTYIQDDKDRTRQIELGTVKFAWLPQQLRDGTWVWLSRYRQTYHWIYCDTYSSLKRYVAVSNISINDPFDYMEYKCK